ncbi:phosphoribosylanthranilate isomerase [Frigoriglobus tundricola]|uniref:N-(5'-phosphoribosyl)anthranilate isomerase n=1 Tax=Frigoriglobus tundricola TaxID=2774151 RepID=A0A6M5Z5G9_9BACT|nr:phosphoribosylanthranilate isomerase [Frigoriglobus tundricola]QJX00945.1 Phosphoribosylanthranilate isomerase [Frigoriglobus tundricola]
MVRIKICGVTSSEDARRAADAGADAIGLNFYNKSSRCVTPQQAAAVVRALPAFTVAVGVFVGTPLRQVCAVAYQLGLRGVQTYDDQPPGEDTFPFAHVPSFRVKDATGLEHVRRFVDAATALGRAPTAVLIDSYVEGQMGGTGHRAPWELLRGFDPGVPVVLAGGLTPENVAEAIATVRPWAVDVASGVERAPGVKDPERMLRFVQNARSAPAPPAT